MPTIAPQHQSPKPFSGPSDSGMCERLPISVWSRPGDMALAIAIRIADLIRQRQKENRRCVLGLATGSTPIGIYDELIRMHQNEGLSFKNVTTFNLDEYWPMNPSGPQSYHLFMREQLFDHVDIDLSCTHVPDGMVSADGAAASCLAYEAKIRAAGGIDLQILGVGRTGHIGFNEPGSPRASRTRLIVLDRVTRNDSASDFFGEEQVPIRALTMGIGTILESKQIILMALGEAKAPIVAKLVEGPISEQIPATFLQAHPSVEVHLDRPAAAHLERERTPWVSRSVDWTPTMIRQAVVWLSGHTKKAILKLTAEDYNENHLQDLVARNGSAHDINLIVFRDLQETITGWPGGKPRDRKQAGDIDRPRDEIFPKRVLIFSPHPDDDVISMGGTLIRLSDQGHEVHVAYQTSGSIAVSDEEARRFLDFVRDYSKSFDTTNIDHSARKMIEVLTATKPSDPDAPEIQRLKSIIRREEAKSAARVCGVGEERLHFLDLPFYETGRVRKKPITDADVDIVVKSLRAIQPHQVYAAGDLSDPHGTHRCCLAAVFAALDVVRSDLWCKQAPIETLLYRGAWQEWGIEAIDMAVPLSPDEVARKRRSIFRHQSQKDRPLFPGADDREFWQRSEARNKATAAKYDALGLAEYEAIEAFVVWNGKSID